MKHYTRRDFDKAAEHRPPDWFGLTIAFIAIAIVVILAYWMFGG